MNTHERALPMGSFASPVKNIGTSAAAMALSPGPEKAQLHQEVIASLLGLCGEASPAKPAAPVRLPWQRSDADGVQYYRKQLTKPDFQQDSTTLPQDLFTLLFVSEASGELVKADDNGDLVVDIHISPYATASLYATLNPNNDAEAAKAHTADSYNVDMSEVLASQKAEEGDTLCIAHDGGAPKSWIEKLLPARTPGSPAKLPTTAPVPNPAATVTPDAEEPLAPSTVNNVETAALGDITSEGAADIDLSSMELDADAAEAAAVLTSAGASDHDGAMAHTPRNGGGMTMGLRGFSKPRVGHAPGAYAALAGEEDPEWQTKPKGRGRPRKRKPFSTAGAGGRGEGHGMRCSHCNTTETPRWWKDNFPIGTLCNACGIWLKRHGYPRPVQFFVNPHAAATNGGSGMAHVAAAAAAMAAVAAAAASPPAATPAPGPASHPRSAPPTTETVAQPGPGQSSGGNGLQSDEFYLINGRPKRRKAGANYAGRYAAVNEGLMPQEDNTANATTNTLAGEDAAMAAAHAAGPADPPINFDAAGGKVFVLRRKLIKSEGTPSAAPTAALVHFGWSPTARAAHDMYDAVVKYEESSEEVAVDDFELLSDCKATATLTLKEGVEQPTSWDSLIRHFLDTL